MADSRKTSTGRRTASGNTRKSSSDTRKSGGTRKTSSDTRKTSSGTRRTASDTRGTAYEYEDDYTGDAPEETRKKHDRHEFRNYALLYLGLIAVINVIFWVSPPACEFYVRYCHPVFLNIYGRFTSLFPFSVGELLIVLGLLIVFLSLFFWIPLVRHRKARRKPNSYYLSKFWYRVVIAIILNVAMIMTLNCVSMYHRDTLDPNPDSTRTDYTFDELFTLRNYLVSEANRLAEEMPRDENGNVTYDGDLQADCKAALHRISDSYPLLSGWYPKVKNMLFSDFMSQMYMAGYYFPFTLEANVNADMYIMNYPACYCHELAHTHGYIYEDEANFIAFLACMESENDFLRYSAILSVAGYVESDLMESAGDTDPASLPDFVYWTEQAGNDDIFLQPEKWEEIEEDAILSTEVVDSVSDTLTETSLQLNGVESGMASYSEVVGLLLQYYDGKLY